MTQDPTKELPRDVVGETENVIETYQIAAEWIRFADAKAAVVLTVNGALASVLIPTLKDFLKAARPPVGSSEPWAQYDQVALVCFVGWAVLTVVSSVFAFLCIQPFRRPDNTHPAFSHCKHFHAAAIAASYGMDEIEKFQTSFLALGNDGFRREALNGLLIDAHISNRKYGYVASAIRSLS